MLWTGLLHLLVVLLSAHTSLAIPAFPGAEGFGASAIGGRGGSVGAGSFRDAVSQSHRIVTFAVGGVIKINSRIVVSSHVTIAGQTAPGQGITVYGNGLSYSGADHSITRYIRYRMGKGGDAGKDGITIANGNNMIFDHVSVSWGRDETFSINGDVSNVTIQDTIIAQGLQTHSCGGLIQTSTGGVSIIRSLYIDNKTRNPKVKGVNEFVNNVVYNWGGGGGYIAGDSSEKSFTNIMNNVFISGPSTSVSPFTRGNANFQTFVQHNYYDSNKNGLMKWFHRIIDTTNSSFTGKLDGAELAATTDNYSGVAFVGTRFNYPTVNKLLAPLDAYSTVLSGAGMSKSRDNVDTLLVNEVKSLGTSGELISDETVSPWNSGGPIAGGTAPKDSDGDGMPDAWEKANGLNPNVNDASGDKNGDGYDNIENYINSLV